MKINVGGAERFVRVLVGVVLLSAVVLWDHPLHWWGMIGIVPLLTGMMGNCPAYSIFGCSTCSSETKHS
jgi:hypothetical protein